MKPISAEQELWYERTFKVPVDWGGKRILLHFGAVDWKADVFVNGAHVGEHTGGYAPFSFDITPFLTDGDNKLVVKVWDPTDSKMRNPTGKQVLNPRGCHYTAVSGIWQTVWLEPVEAVHIAKLKVKANLDASRFEVKVESSESADYFEAKIFDGTRLVAQAKGAIGEWAHIGVENPKLWSPDSPFLYNMEVGLFKGGEAVDTVKSYAAMRKVSIIRVGKKIKGVYVKNGEDFKWIALNNEKIYMLGPLDQGWWPDGLYTAPTDEALKFDIQKTKDWGFNMIRKHIKVEPARWYMHCDKIGILVWQDMPSCEQHVRPWETMNFAAKDAEIREADTTARDGKVRGGFKPVTRRDVDNFRKELAEVVDALDFFPSIVMWIPFNEGWGQFDTVNTVDFLRSLDSTRPINAASGGNYFQCGDIIDIHNYPAPKIKLFSLDYANVMGEYGGISIDSIGHQWDSNRKFAYNKSMNSADGLAEYSRFADILRDMVKIGIVSAVYTQTTDVEIEYNGIMTYDRKYIKMDEKKLNAINVKLIEGAVGASEK